MGHSLTALRERCDAALDHLLPASKDDRLLAAMRYAILGGGKRLRPLLVYATGAALGVSLDRLDPAAAAIELVHGYSLVHDDLPAMDDDDLRRGRATVHRAFDEATAILAGDALLTLAFEALHGGVEAGLSASAVLEQTRTLAHASGHAGMVGGQNLDLALVGQQPDYETLTRMHRLKTGALIAAAVRLGMLAGAADAQTQQALEHYALNLGLAFQIQDDVLDETGDSAITGKAQGADRTRGKPTFTSLLGIETARTQAEDLIDAALSILDHVSGDPRLLHEIALHLMGRQH